MSCARNTTAKSDRSSPEPKEGPAPGSSGRGSSVCRYRAFTMRGMADLIGWATSPAGVITQAVVALVCQFIGFLIVVVEIVQSRSDFR